MNFSPHIRTFFAVRGASAVYAPPVGATISCKAIRQGGGQAVWVGPVMVTTERVSFHVQRSDILVPVVGATLDYRGESFTIDAVQPVERDAEGLLWSLEASWGADMIYRSVSGSGASQNPPQGSGYTVASAAAAGATVISIKAPLAIGKLLPGDKIEVAGSVYAVTGAGVQAVMQQFSAIPISPVLAANAALGDPVMLTFARDRTLRGAVASYQAAEFMGGVQAGDRRVVIMQAALSGLDEKPKAGDRIVLDGRAFNVQSAVAIYQGANPVAWDIQVRS